MVYFSSSIDLALAEKGQYDLLKIITIRHKSVIIIMFQMEICLSKAGMG